MISIEELRKRKIYLYGIGKLGKKNLEQLRFFQIEVQGILVSEEKNLPGSYQGIAIEKFGKRPIPKDALVLVNVPQKAIEEVSNKLIAQKVDYLVWNTQNLEELWLQAEHRFDDRRQYKDKVLFILAGYKEFLWDKVFKRVEKYVPKDTEVCILSAGLRNERLERMAADRNWSYLSTSINSVTLIQNIAYSKYSDYNWIYKMDEDIFLTENVLSKLFDAYERIEKNEPYHIGVVAPLIPLNEHCCRYVLEKFGCLEDFEKRYGNLFFGGDGMLINTVDIAPYLWGKYETVPDIDTMNERCQDDKSFSLCATRFNIGLIMFNRSLWEDMYGFSVSGGTDLGADEEEMCAWCTVMSRPIIVSHDTLAGHFSFVPQEENMRQFFDKSKERVKELN